MTHMSNLNLPDGLINFDFLDSDPDHFKCEYCGKSYPIAIGEQLNPDSPYTAQCHHCLYYEGSIDDKELKKIEMIGA
jgi:hypothetical protein